MTQFSTLGNDYSLSNVEIENGNNFGGSIEFREGVPIQLLKYNERSRNGNFGQIVLNQEALNVLRTINEPLAIISVVGSFRRGKSWFANVLHGRHDGFELGAKVEGCTRGIYMWSPPFKLESKQSDGEIIQKRVIVLDSEGIDDPKQDENWATKLFILCLVVSSTFIYNINGIVESPESLKEYFLEKLNNVDPKAAKGIKKFFYGFDVFGLPHPGCKKTMVQHMENAITDNLDEEFVEEVENAVKSIYSQLPLKYIGSSTMKGMAFVKFLQDTVERMNSSETSTLLSIPSEYESIIQYVSREATNEALEIYKKRMSQLISEEKLPMIWEEFEEKSEECASETRKLFSGKIIGSPIQIEKFIDQLSGKLSKIKENFTKKNSKELMIYNENIAKKYWEKFVKIGLTLENLFENYAEFQKALKSFELAYEKSSMKSPEAARVIASYMKNQYSEAIDYMTQLGRMNAELAKAVHAKEEAERLRIEALAREGELCRKIEAQKREREESGKNFGNKILELQRNIEQQKKSQEEMQHRLIKEREYATKRYNQKYEQMRDSMLEQRRLNEKEKMELIKQQERKFEQIQRSLIEEHNRKHEELKRQLDLEKMKANQNEIYQRKLLKKIEASSRDNQELLEQIRTLTDNRSRGIDWKDIANVATVLLPVMFKFLL
ncbi:guanylate-binding protein [Rhizophagus irregularis DAOM 181602=DAOM 197198]|uniref:Guanylate-binding protein n=1 Tax=Rhizophagus irregularis (strain DAOM 181602 / DAOM 197198 / MUCL 43194) TaxID=747089 RepID=A0A2P4PUF7_RHIID|nr:guanylate-binding protein [Rhizophagus irregularis DAOM 181602=DAOM 197198]POG69004.1 guanylate-binding protein [Rhizophagus irregularis DAOM 181602=DAOM 197198]|eukprot:XP_025175870.1 guanylate-binding protein [Rhizophagus irregularis DAOM 181602=DAOM 197198]